MDPDEAGFLAAIIASPDDNHPRLVYADYLDERGDARGEFIRCQCQIGQSLTIRQADHALTTSYGVAGSQRVAYRPCELLRQYKAEWLGDALFAANIRAVRDWVWQRGFLTQLALPWPNWLAHGDAIRAGNPLERVTLTTEVPYREHANDPHPTIRINLGTTRCPMLNTYEHLRHPRDHHDAILRSLARQWPGIGFTLTTALS